MNGPLTYVAGAYTGDHAANVREALDVQHQLLEEGIPCIVPHLSHFADIVHPLPYETWMALDLVLVERCDWVLRLDNVSSGADREVSHARAHHVSVWEMTGCAGTSVERFIEHVTGELAGQITVEFTSYEQPEILESAYGGTCAIVPSEWDAPMHGFMGGPV